LTSTWHS
jgi:hypothetical protein